MKLIDITEIEKSDNKLFYKIFNRKLPDCLPDRVIQAGGTKTFAKQTKRELTFNHNDSTFIEILDSYLRSE